MYNCTSAARVKRAVLQKLMFLICWTKLNTRSEVGRVVFAVEQHSLLQLNSIPCCRWTAFLFPVNSIPFSSEQHSLLQVNSNPCKLCAWARSWILEGAPKKILVHWRIGALVCRQLHLFWIDTHTRRNFVRLRFLRLNHAKLDFNEAVGDNLPCY